VIDNNLHPNIFDYTTPISRITYINALKPRTHAGVRFPPLDPSHRGNVVRLLELYLDHIHTDDLNDDTLWHPLSIYLSQARQVANNSLDSWAVGLTVAVEGIARRIPFTPPVSETDFSSLATKVGDFLAQEDYPDAIKKRVDGMLRGMGAASAKDRMYSLIKSGNVIESDINAWSKCRNSAVHTKHINPDDLMDSNMQAQTDRLLTVHRLMHSLIFYLIGYTGEYTNYAARHFPTDTYPFAVRSQVD
jgi:hypothetical protein